MPNALGREMRKVTVHKKNKVRYESYKEIGF